jgi:putative transposase
VRIRIAPSADMGHHAAPRLPHFDYVGLCRYSLTCCTFRRIKWFADEAIVEKARSRLLRTMAACGFGTTAYCFMPDHVHVLLEGRTEGCELKPTIQLWKQMCGYEHRRAFAVPLWQTGYYDRVLRDEADTLAAAAYIVANPLRAGLAESVLEYPYCGSDRYTLDELAQAVQIGHCRRDG